MKTLQNNKQKKPIFLKLILTYRHPQAGPVWFLLILLAAYLSGCAPIRYEMGETEEAASAGEAIHNAEEFLKTRPNWKVDCSHFVLACYHSRSMNAFLNRRKYNHNLVYDLNYYLTQRKARRKRAADIQPGDILIFNKTYDINHDGRIDDRDKFTHAGIVESFRNWVVTYIDASGSRKPPRIHRRHFSFIGNQFNETVARDPATGRGIHARETFHAAYAPP